MDHLNKRMTKLLLILSEQRDFVTADTLSKLLNLSKKSIYREIKAINERQEEFPLIISERGRGYKLDYDRYISQGNSLQRREINPRSRQNRVIETLLLCSPHPMKVEDLYMNDYVSDSTIALDEKMMIELLEPFHLRLVRQNKRLSIVGSEIHIRKALIELFQPLEVTDMEKFCLSNHFNKYDSLFVSDQLSEIEKSIGSHIPYPYNINIFSHLYILIARSRKGYSEDMNQALSEEEEEAMRVNDEYRQIASSIIETTENYLHRALSRKEVFYLYQYLISCRLTHRSEKQMIYSHALKDLTEDLIDEVERKLNRNFHEAKLINDLVQHMKPLINRLENNIYIHNPLLGQIQAAYPEIFKALTECVEGIESQYGKISADEIGFLTVYFARVMENSSGPIKTIIMCTTGIGTSELIRVKVKNKFPQLEVMQVVSRLEIDQALRDVDNVQLILTTIDYTPKLPISTLLISVMLTVKDCERIQGMIEQITGNK